MTENERLTIYEIIEHCKRKVRKIESMFRKEHLESDHCGVADIIQKEYWEHRQVANYLRELQQYRAIGTVEEFKILKEKEERFDRNIKMFNEIGLEIRNKAIDEFAELFKNWMFEKYGLSQIDISEINEIAEQLKGGAT